MIIIISILAGLLIIAIVALENVILINHYKKELRDKTSSLTLDLLNKEHRLITLANSKKSDIKKK
jgi:hypothetical protein